MSSLPIFCLSRSVFIASPSSSSISPDFVDILIAVDSLRENSDDLSWREDVEVFSYGGLITIGFWSDKIAIAVWVRRASLFVISVLYAFADSLSAISSLPSK